MKVFGFAFCVQLASALNVQAGTNHPQIDNPPDGSRKCLCTHILVVACYCKNNAFRNSYAEVFKKIFPIIINSLFNYSYCLFSECKKIWLFWFYTNVLDTNRWQLPHSARLHLTLNTIQHCFRHWTTALWLKRWLNNNLRMKRKREKNFAFDKRDLWWFLFFQAQKLSARRTAFVTINRTMTLQTLCNFPAKRYVMTQMACYDSFFIKRNVASELHLVKCFKTNFQVFSAVRRTNPEIVPLPG